MNNPYFNLIRNVWHYGEPWRPTIVSYYCSYIVAQASLGLSPYAFGRTIDILQHFTPERLYEVVLWLSVGVIVLLVFWLFHGPARVKERIVAMEIDQRLRQRLYEKLTQLPLKWHQDQHSGNIISRIHRASKALHNFAESQFHFIELIIKFLVATGFLIWISLPVGLLSLAAGVLNTCVVFLFDRRLIPLYVKQNEIDNHVSATLFDYISNITTILTLRLGELTHTHLTKRMMAIWPFFRKDVVLNEIKWFSIGVLLAIMESLILIGYIVYHLRIDNVIMIGTVVMIFRYQNDLRDVFFNLSGNYSELVRRNTDVQGLQPLLDDIEKYAHVPEGESLARQWHMFTVSNLVFHHTDDRHNEINFDHLSFTVKRGEKIALIGASGGGKSTLLNLLRGLYTPAQAKLTMDGVPFGSLEPLQVITTLIPQDAEIFANTIAFNITLDVTENSEEIDRAVRLAGFSPVLETLPKGLATDIREKGVNLSVGQKQRLALTRGLFAARFSSLILMDEPTSSVDLPTEKTILSGIITAFADSAIIVSLHRLHLLPKFDRIIMLSEGKIVAEGQVKDLLSQPGPVRDLWQEYQAHEAEISFLPIGKDNLS